MPISKMYGLDVTPEVVRHIIDTYSGEACKGISIIKNFEYKELAITFLHKLESQKRKAEGFTDRLLIIEVGCLYEWEEARFVIFMKDFIEELKKNYTPNSKKWIPAYIVSEGPPQGVYWDNSRSSEVENILHATVFGPFIARRFVDNNKFPVPSDIALKCILEKKYLNWLPLMLGVVTGEDFTYCLGGYKLSGARAKPTEVIHRAAVYRDAIEEMQKAISQMEKLNKLIQQHENKLAFEKWLISAFKEAFISEAPTMLDDPEFGLFAKYLLKECK